MIYWLCLLVTGVSAVVSAGFSVAAVVSDRKDVSALHAASRSIALVVGVVVAAFLSSTALAVTLATVMTVVQAMDALIGVRIDDRMKTLGPAFLAVLTAAAAIALIATR
jgi:uncharacterized membrane protein HdeD (DUF308 family)